MNPEQPVTLEAIDALLKSQRLRPFMMEVETDSTIAPDEQAEKTQRIEFLTAVGGFINQASGAVQAFPQSAPFMAEMLKFGAGGFRAGRELGGAIEQFTETVKAGAAQAGGEQEPSPEMVKAQIEAQKMQAQMQMDAQKMQAEMARFQADNQIKQAELQMRAQEMQIRQQESAARSNSAQMQAQTRDYDARVNAAVKQMDLMLKAKQLDIAIDDQKLKEAQAEIQALLDVEELEMERTQQRPVAIGETS